MGKNESKFSHLLMVRARGLTPPSYGQPDRKISVFYDFPIRQGLKKVEIFMTFAIESGGRVAYH